MSTDIRKVKLRDFHALRWDESIIEKSVKGERGVLIPAA